MTDLDEIMCDEKAPYVCKNCVPDLDDTTRTSLASKAASKRLVHYQPQPEIAISSAALSNAGGDALPRDLLLQITEIATAAATNCVMQCMDKMMSRMIGEM